jgi:PhnB protein
MTLNPCINLTFDGRCEAAFKFYERCLGGEIAFMLTWGDSPMAKDAPPGWGGKILYARLALGDTALTGGDVPPQTYQRPRGISVMLSVDDADDAERLFRALSENGIVNTALQKTFWALRYGGVTDQFGIPWEINCEQSE